MKRFEGKLAVISGGASGMGAATAKGFTSEGGSVISIDIDEEGGKVSRLRKIIDLSNFSQYYFGQSQYSSSSRWNAGR